METWLGIFVEGIFVMKQIFFEIQNILESKSDGQVRKSVLKFVPTSENSYGVKLPLLADLVENYKHHGAELVEALWKSGRYEEKILAAKILSKISDEDSGKTLELIEKFSDKIRDWSVCDTLATQSIRKIAQANQKEIFDLSRKLVKSKKFWQRRFGLVLLINYVKDERFRKEIRDILKTVEGDKEKYVKRAVLWIESNF